MGMKEEFNRASAWVRDHFTLDKHYEASVFETIIRIVGGFMSAYDLSGDYVRPPNLPNQAGGGRKDLEKSRRLPSELTNERVPPPLCLCNSPTPRDPLRRRCASGGGPARRRSRSRSRRDVPLPRCHQAGPAR